MSIKTGGFTLPGEAGYEKLTLNMAKKWGADVIRDSDGTQLSREIMEAGYGIYSTLCVIRGHNQWAKTHPKTLQQTFLMTSPVTAKEKEISISLLKDFFEEQFQVNEDEKALSYCQVFDRTINKEVPREKWYYEKGCVVIRDCVKWHKYTVNFLAYRIWEEISMYNHVTNHWDKEHLMPIDPMYEEVQEYLLSWLEKWCQEHPATTVVRFTSLFYNFTWIWGSSIRNRNLFTDWGSYDFTVSVRALEKFKEKYGYRIYAEDFINQGKLQVTHMPPTKSKLDWMEFINDFVIEYGKKLVDLVHRYGKAAYVFYDDSWVGMEPYGERFQELGFDGIIKCVFSGYEVRLCSGTKVPVHELRLHPYLFSVGLNGTPTFAKGGNPTFDAKKYWVNVRRALLRTPIQRIGLGGYLHLVEQFPDFCDYIEKISDEFRNIKSLLEGELPYICKIHVGVLHCWGKLRSWTLSGHFHETDGHDLIHINEALSGLPVEVDFIDFEQVREDGLSAYQVIINAGRAGDAWSGGNNWKEDKVVENLTKWVYEGGIFLGVNEPSAVEGYDTYFRMAHVLGADEDTGAKVCHGRWKCQVVPPAFGLPEDNMFVSEKDIYLTDGNAEVWAAGENGTPVCTRNRFGKGQGIYLSGFRFSSRSCHFLLNLLLLGRDKENIRYLSDNPEVECAFFPKAETLVVINNSGQEQTAEIQTKTESVKIALYGYETKFLAIGE